MLYIEQNTRARYIAVNGAGRLLTKDFFVTMNTGQIINV
jgi:hypothetical protein